MQTEGYCECGCQTALPPGRRFVHGHNRRTPAAADYSIDENGCWIWQRHRNRNGYGTTSRRREGGSGLAHRVYYEARFGPVDASRDLDHICRNRACVNPDHLELVTHAENCRRGGYTKLSSEQVVGIRRAMAAGISQSELGRRYGVHQTTINAIHIGKSWRGIA